MENINENYEKLISNAEEIGKDIDGKEILSDKDINKIAEVIDDIDSPSKEFLTKAKEEAAKDHEGEESKANIVINPVTGNPMLVHDITEDKDDNLQSFEEMLVDDSIKPQDIKIEDVKIQDTTAKNVAETLFGVKDLSLEDVDILVKAVERFKTGEKFAYYNALPDSIKTSIDRILGNSEVGPKMGNYLKEGKNYLASQLYKEILSNDFTNTALYDLNKSINTIKKEATEEIKKDEYWNRTRKYFLEEIPEKIKEAEKNEDTNLIERLEKSRASFIESYTLKDMHDKWRHGKCKVKKIQIEKFKRTCEEFNLKYQKSQNLITDLRTIYASLDRNVNKRIDADIIKEFMCIFVNYVKNMNPNDIYDHIFMYYFIYNINLLDMFNSTNEEDIAFRDELLNNINNFLFDIVEFHHRKE